MASARQQILQERRSSSLGGSRIRILAPVNTGISTIAQKSAANELDLMINKYNNGQLGNEEMKSFLQTQLASPYTSSSDKTQIQTKLSDFDTLIEKDRLESQFKSAQENTLQKEQAAQALARFYQTRASTMVAGTPAHSQALENAGIWQQNVQNIRTNVNREQRKNLETAYLQKVNQLPTSSSERSLAQVEMYQKLSDMAQAQGDPEDAQAYLAKKEQAATVASQYQEQELASNNKTAIKQFAAEQDLAIAKLTNNTSDELKAKAEKAYAVAQKYADIGDQLNYTKYMTIGTQAEEKYNKKLESMTGESMAKEWDKTDDEYRKTVEQAQKDLASGKLNINQYSAGMASMLNQRKTDLADRIGYVEQLDSNQKIKVNGKNIRAEDLLTKYYSERDVSSGLGYGDKSEDGGLTQKMNDFSSGNVVAVVVPPKEVTKSGSVSLAGSEVARISFVNKDNLGEGDWAEDGQGLFHLIKRETIPLTQDQAYQAAQNNGYFTDSNGVSQRVQFDPNSGDPYIYGQGKKVDINEPGTARKVTVDYTGEKVPSFSEDLHTFQKSGMRSLDSEAAQVVQEKVKAAEKQKMENITPVIAGTKPNLIKDTNVITPTTVGQVKPVNIAQKPTGEINMPGLEVQTPANAPVTEQIKVQSPEPVKVNQPGIQPVKVSQPTPGLTYQTPVAKAPVISAPSTAPAVKINTTTAMPGLQVQKPAPAPAPQPNLLQSAANIVGGIGTSIKNTASDVLKKLKFW